MVSKYFTPEELVMEDKTSMGSGSFLVFLSSESLS